jgi:hypothetical protein
VRRFAWACFLGVFAVMSAVSWVDPLRDAILRDVIHVGPGLAAACKVPFILFTLMPVAVGPRAYLQGVAILRKQTKLIAPSGIVRMAVVLASCALLPRLGVHGAAMGLGALAAGFLVEAPTIYWMMWRQGRREAAAALSEPAAAAAVVTSPEAAVV